ncbi:MAG TPA: right-handed parallel beta-helix repeat-containing protein [Candidatus Binatia bacterium]|nr:right-handed parallel beta-helix repeat-containing protein [Candidatus Binatia bacterium]
MRSVSWLVLLTVATGLFACGGGGGGETTAPPPPNPLYVRITGNNTNSGASPASALQSISKAMQLALDGYTIIVGGGTYLEGVTSSRTGGSAEHIQLLADVSGAQTGDSGPVVISAEGNAVPTALTIAQSPGTVVDGFIITGSSDAGIVIKSSSTGLTIQNCIVFNNAGDGIRVQDSAQVVLFNNLVYGNAGIGLNITGSISGSPDARVLNNTVALHRSRGITIGQSQVASPRTLLRNNIIYGNTGDASIKVFTPPPSSVPRSDVGYDEDFDLMLPFTVIPFGLETGVHDVTADPQFVQPSVGNFRVSADSPAIGAGIASALSASQAAILRARTVTGTNLDGNANALGFHYLP